MGRISAVRVQNFRSISDTGFVELHDGMTSLVGKNEAGKSNFLCAVESMRPDVSYEESDLCRYSDVSIQDDFSEVEMVTFRFSWPMSSEPNINLEINSEEQNQIDCIEITKRFDGTYKIKFCGIDEATTVIGPNQSVDADPDVVVSLVDEVLTILDSIQDDPEFIDMDLREKYFRDYKKEVESGKELSVLNMRELVNNLDVLLHNIKSQKRKKLVEVNTDNYIQSIESIKFRLKEMRSEIFDSNENIESSTSDGFFQEVADFLPKIVFHNELDRLPDQVRTNRDDDSVQLTFDLFELAGVSSDDIDGRESRELERVLKQRIGNVFESINDQWQRELDFEMSYFPGEEELTITITDENEPSFAQIRPSDRSEGFQYFVSFCLSILLRFESGVSDTVLLFDGPGEQLHPGAKRDLLEILEEISEDSQVIYSTHSPFLVDGESLDRVRVVTRDDTQGYGTGLARLGDDELGSVEPVWTALGADMERSPFGKERNILVEGRSDKVYVEALSNYLRKRGRTESAIDTDETTIIPVGGDGKMEYFSRFAEEHNYDYVALLDDDSSETEEIRSEEVIDEDRICTLGDFVEELHEYAAIEDLLQPDLAYEAFRATYPNLPDDEPKATFGNVPTAPVAAKYNNYVEDNIDGETFDGSAKATMAEHVEEITEQSDCDDERLGESTIENFKDLFEGLSARFDDL